MTFETLLNRLITLFQKDFALLAILKGCFEERPKFVLAKTVSVLANEIAKVFSVPGECFS